MKKSFFIILLLSLSFGLALQAQTAVSFGVKAGLNYANVWDESGQDFTADAKAGFAGGVFLGIPLGSHFGFQPELLISQKGFKGSGTMFGQGYTFSRTTTHIDIPLQLQVKPVDKLTLLAGPQYSYLMHAKNVYNMGTVSSGHEEAFENDNIRRNMLGFVLGADVNLLPLVISGRVAWDFQNNHGDGSSSTPRYKNQWLQFTLGYKI